MIILKANLMCGVCVTMRYERRACTGLTGKPDGRRPLGKTEGWMK
jgi:hypothetical protein